MRKQSWTRRLARPWLGLGSILAIGAAVPVAAAPPNAPTFPACLAAGPRVTFAGHTFPLDSVPTPAPMNAVDAFPSLPAFLDPVFVTAAPDGTSRLFVLERAGRIFVFDALPGVTQRRTFLDIRAITDPSGGEVGLLGLAFSPDYATSGYFYLNYIAPPSRCADTSLSCTKVVRYRVSANPEVADPQSELLLFEVAQPFSNHNGGMLAFGADGMLYGSLGDGGSFGDPFDSAQNRSVLLGKIFRIDPRGGVPYAIPVGNPYRGNVQGWRPEIWAYGLRNPWRFSVDRVTGELWIGDVGQDSWEEIDRLAPGQAGVNLGWNHCEGTHDYNGYSCASLGATPPVLEYPHDAGIGGFSVTGGYVYRGARLPQLYGSYLYADYVSGHVWAWTGSGAPTIVASLTGISSFGEDRDGELYLARLSNGRLYRLDPASGSGASFPTTLSATGLFANTANLDPAPGLIEYRVNTPLWSDGATKRRWIALPGSARVSFDPTGSWTFPIGTAFVKHFEIATGPATVRRLETRVLLRQLGDWVGYTYRWNDAQTDAALVTIGQLASHPTNFGTPATLDWYYPGPADCTTCHALADGRVLGARTRQLNLEWSCVGGSNGTERQIDAWSALGLFSASPPPATSLEAYSDVADFSAPLGRRARSYLAVNCAICHQPTGAAPGGLDLRFDTALSAMNVVGVPVSQGTLGLANALRLRPGDHATSMLWYRMQLTDPAVHMPAGSRKIDALGAYTVAGWIDADPTRDRDGDGVVDDVDNCPGVANPAQTDRGGVGSASGPDGIGDACQCGDVSGDGRVTAADATLLQRSLLNPPTAVLAHPELCDVGGSPGCGAGDVVILQRALLTPPTASIALVCTP